MKTTDAESVVSGVLGILPYLVTKESLGLTTVTRDLRVAPDYLRDMLDVIQFCGLPPYGGGDTFDLVLENGRVSLTAPLVAFARPVRLSAREAAALAVGLTIIDRCSEAEREAVAGAKEKALDCLASGSPPLQADRLQLAALDNFPEQQEFVEALVRASQGRRRVEIDYYSLSSGAVRSRVVEPHRVDCIRGHWYLLAHCTLRRRVLHFRLDRIRNLRTTSERFTASSRRPTLHEEPAEYDDGGGDTVELRMPLPEAQRLVDRGSTFVRQVEDRGNGEARVLIRGGSERWVARLVMGYAGQAEVVRPAGMRRNVAKIVKESLAAYGEAS